MARQALIKVVLTASEKEAILAKAKLAGKSASEFLRDLGLGNAHTQTLDGQSNGQQSGLERLEAAILGLQQQVAKLTDGYGQENSHAKSMCVEWGLGETITAQHSKRYGLLQKSRKVWQTVKSSKGRDGKYCWFIDLGLVCKMTGQSRSDHTKYKVYFVLRPGEELLLTPEGNFMHPDGKCYWSDNTQKDGQIDDQENSQESEQVSSEAIAPDTTPQDGHIDDQENGHEAEQVDSEATAPETDQPVTRSSDQEDDQVLELSLDELAQRLSEGKLPASRKTLKGNLEGIGGLKNTDIQRGKIIRWTTERDPEELGWLPVDSDRTRWKSQKVTPKDDQKVDPEKPSLVQS